MPNHLHFIISISAPPVGANHDSPCNNNAPDSKIGANHDSPLHKKRSELSKIIGYLKANSTKEIRKLPDNPFYIWQRNYYEHIIRDKQDLFQKNQYIKNNPRNWSHDPENKHPKLP